MFNMLRIDNVIGYFAMERHPDPFPDIRGSVGGCGAYKSGIKFRLGLL